MAATKSDVVAIVNGKAEGFVIEIRPENLFQDQAGTTPVTSDGDPVALVKDQAGGTHDFVDHLGTPTYKTDGTLHWLEFSAASSHSLVSVDDMGPAISGNPYFVSAGVVWTSLPPNEQGEYFFGVRATSNSNRDNSVVHIGAADGTTAKVGHWANDGNYSYTYTQDVVEVHSAAYKDPGSEYWVDGTSVGSNASVPDQLDQLEKPLIFERQRADGVDTNQSFMNGLCYGIVFFVGTVSTQDRETIEEWLSIEAGLIDPGVSGSGSLQAQTATVDGAATREVTGSGTLQADTATVSGTGTLARDATGTLQAQQATVDGSGSTGAEFVGSGALDAGTATVDGTATREITGTGTLQAVTSEVDGSGGPVVPSVQLVGSAESTFNIGNSSTLTVSKPTGVQDGDVLLAFMSVDGVEAMSLPSGFTELGGGSIGDTHSGLSGYKVAGSSEPSSYDFTKDTGEIGYAALVAFRGLDVTSLVDTAASSQTGTSATPTTPSISTTGTKTVLIAWFAGEAGDMALTDYPSGMDGLVGRNAEADGGSGSGTGAAIGIAWQELSSSGGTGTRAFTISNADEWLAEAFALTVDAGAEGTGTLQADTAAVAGTGSMARDATGALQADTAVVAGTATREVTGSGALQADTATVAGSAALIHEAEGTLQADTATVAGIAVREVTGSGALQADTATVAGTAVRGIAGTGTLQADTATTTGAGVMSREASGALQAQRAEVSGFGGEGFLGSGELQAGAAEVTGAGTMGRTATGALQAQTATVDGTAVREVTGTGVLQADTGVVDGTGARGSAGTGALQADTGVMDGTASREITGQGALQATTAIVDGGTGSSGQGALQAGTATVSGTGVREITGTGALQADVGTTDGVAVREVTGTGALQAGAASVTGEGLPFKTAEGALQAGGASVTASVATGKVAGGDLQASRATLDANVSRTIKGSGVLRAHPVSIRLPVWISVVLDDEDWQVQDEPSGSWTKTNI